MADRRTARPTNQPTGMRGQGEVTLPKNSHTLAHARKQTTHAYAHVQFTQQARFSVFLKLFFRRKGISRDYLPVRYISFFLDAYCSFEYLTLLESTLLESTLLESKAIKLVCSIFGENNFFYRSL